MSVVVCRSPDATFLLEKDRIGAMLMIPAATARDSPANQHTTCAPPMEISKVEQHPAQLFDVCSLEASVVPVLVPYVHPLARRSSSLMSQTSLEMCTESLGSETGSDGFSLSFSSDDDMGGSSLSSSEMEEEDIEEKDPSPVNYHCSISRRSLPRSFPPPLSSISRRDGPRFHMRPHRKDGRLILEAIPAPSQNYLHVRRQDGRLLLSFVDTTFHRSRTEADTTEIPPEPQDLKQEVGSKPEEKFCYGEEEEVVEMGTMVEVKVPLPSLMNNNFVEGNTNMSGHEDKESNYHHNCTIAAVEPASPPENKMLLTTNREELLHHQVGRCSHLPRPLFFWEPRRIATT